MENILPKLVDECQTKNSEIEDQDAADVGDTCVEGFGPLLSRCNTHDSPENQNTGAKDYQAVLQDHRKYHHIGYRRLKVMSAQANLITS